MLLSHSLRGTTDPQKYNQLIFDKGTIQYNQERVFLTNDARTTGEIHVEK